MGDNGSSYSKIESIWSNAVRLTRSVYPNLQDEIEYIEANLGGGNISCNCSALEFAIENLSTIKLSRDGSQPMEGELVCNSGLKTNVFTPVSGNIVNCMKDLRVWSALAGNGSTGLGIYSNLWTDAPYIKLYPYISSAKGKIVIGTPMANGTVIPRIEIPGGEDDINIKLSDADLEPYHDNSLDLGSSNKRWKNIYATKGNFSGVMIPDEIISNADDIANLSLIKLSRDGSQPMTGILTCQSGIKTNSLTTVSGDIVTCEKDVIVNSHIWGNPLLTIGSGAGFTDGYPHIKFSYSDLILLTPGESGPLERIFIYGGWDDGEIMIKNADLAPFTDNRWDLGFPGYTWRCVYAAKGNFSGTIIPDAILTNSANISDLDARVDYLEENLSTCNCSALQLGIDSNTTEIANLSTIKLSRDGSQTMTGLLQCESGLKTDTIDSYSGDTVECSDDLKVNGDILGDSANGLMLKAEDIFAPATIELTSGTAGKIIMSTGTPQPALLPRLEIPWGPGFVDITVSYAHVIPDIDNQQNLGSPSKRWKNVYAVLVNSSNISNLEERVEYLESIIGKMGGRGPYTAIIYKDNGIIYAKNANGEIITQGAAGTDDATVIKTVLESGGKIIIMPATYTLYFTVTGSTDLITLPQNTIVDGLSREETKLEFYIDGSTPSNYFNVAELVVRSNCIVRNLTIDGKKDYFEGKEYLQYLIAIREGDEKSKYDIIENVKLLNSKRCGIVPDCSCTVIRNIITDNCPQALDSDRVDNLLVEGFVATNCQNAFYFESDVIDVTLRNFYFEPRYRGVYMPLSTATFKNIVIEEGTINIPSGLDGWDIYAFEIGAEVKALTIRNVKIKRESAHPGAFRHLVAEHLGDIIIENCDVGYMESVFPYGCSNLIIDGGRYQADYVFINNPSGFLVKNAYIYTAWHVFHDSPSSIHFENCYLSSLGSDGTESDITFRRCTIGDKKSDNSGIATISNGDTSVTVTHGLYKAPAQVFLTGTHNEVAKCWVTDVSDTEFTINAPSAVTDDRDVYWEATMS